MRSTSIAVSGGLSEGGNAITPFGFPDPSRARVMRGTSLELELCREYIVGFPGAVAVLSRDSSDSLVINSHDHTLPTTRYPAGRTAMTSFEPKNGEPHVAIIGAGYEFSIAYMVMR